MRVEFVPGVTTGLVPMCVPWGLIVTPSLVLATRHLASRQVRAEFSTSPATATPSPPA